MIKWWDYGTCKLTVLENDTCMLSFQQEVWDFLSLNEEHKETHNALILPKANIIQGGKDGEKQVQGGQYGMFSP